MLPKLLIGVVANMLDCDTIVSEFEFHWHYNVLYGQILLEIGAKALISIADMGQTGSTQFVFEDRFDIKYPTKFIRT